MPGINLPDHAQPPQDNDWEVVVVGAGAAGLLAAARCAELGRRTLLVEKNRKAGVKILMSGGTRCNLTQATDRRGIIEAFGTQGRFLHSALSRLGPDELVQLVEAEGVPTKREPTGKIFPASDKAKDILDAFLRRLGRSGASLRLETAVTHLQREESHWKIETSRGALRGAHLIVTTGGQSYPGCGTTGDGYAWAAALGHTIVEPRPALVPIKLDVPWLAALSGVTLPDVRLALVPRNSPPGAKPIAEVRGGLVCTHWGVSGPVVLNLSSHLVRQPAAWKALVAGTESPVELSCDFRPDDSREIVRTEISAARQSRGQSTLGQLETTGLPHRFVEGLLASHGLSGRQRIAELTRAQASAWERAWKETRLSIAGLLGFEKAEVTAGGIALDEIDSRTMRSKVVPGLSFAGEVLDLDGPIGGFNFQAAFSTGWLAAEQVG